jgi:hypothetical protein
MRVKVKDLRIHFKNSLQDGFLGRKKAQKAQRARSRFCAFCAFLRLIPRSMMEGFLK